jgi:hypothetical protein
MRRPGGTTGAPKLAAHGTRRGSPPFADNAHYVKLRFSAAVGYLPLPMVQAVKYVLESAGATGSIPDPADRPPGAVRHTMFADQIR